MSRRTGLGSLQTHKVIILPDGKGKKRIPRDFGDPHDIVQLADTYRLIRLEHGEKNFKNWIVKQSAWYGKKVPAYNG